jgi:hypothetical protein
MIAEALAAAAKIADALTPVPNQAGPVRPVECRMLPPVPIAGGMRIEFTDATQIELTDAEAEAIAELVERMGAAK